MSNLKKSIIAHIEAIAAAEKITRASLAEISRELLMYVPDTKDIDMVNRLLNVLTPMNRATAVLFFRHFLAWEWEEDANKFGGMMQGDKKISKRATLISEFLKDTDNNIWTWAAANVEVEKVKPNLAEGVATAVHRALNGTKETRGKEAAEPLSKAEVMSAFLDSFGSIDDAFNAITVAKTAADDAMKEAFKQAEAA